MAYENDTLVFLHTHQDFNFLEQLIAQYTLASNAKLNFHKTRAFSLSGKSSHYWTTFLHSREIFIHSWHDRHSLYGLTYLGYPLYFNASQKKSGNQPTYTYKKYNANVTFILHVTYPSKAEQWSSSFYFFLDYVMIYE